MNRIAERLHRLLASLPRSPPRLCCLCEQRVGRFLPYRGSAGDRPHLMQALEVVGSDIDNFECPRCGGHDRERHMLMYLRASGLLSRLAEMRILHFAPEHRLSHRVAIASPVRYTKCDLHPGAEDVERVDIEAMPFDAGSFDLVIANHVLEHVGDDIRAVAEIHRVLAPGGMAVLQTPYSPMLRRTWADSGIRCDQARRQAYGQEDHVRLFGEDIFERIESGGLRACISTHSELLADFDASTFGVNPREPFFLFRRDA